MRWKFLELEDSAFTALDEACEGDAEVAISFAARLPKPDPRAHIMAASDGPVEIDAFPRDWVVRVIRERPTRDGWNVLADSADHGQWATSVRNAISYFANRARSTIVAYCIASADGRLLQVLLHDGRREHRLGE